MKKLVRRYALISAAGFLLFATKAAFALDFSNVKSQVGGTKGIRTDNDILPVVFQIINYVLVVTGAFAVLMLIIGGFRYVSSAGNDTQLEGAKVTITWAIVGLVIVLLAYVIAATVNTILLGNAAGGTGGKVTP